MNDVPKKVEIARENWYKTDCKGLSVALIKDVYERGFNRAYRLMKAKEPVEPKCEINANGQVLSCGNCGTWFTVQKQKYCYECGRAVKWDD